MSKISEMPLHTGSLVGVKVPVLLADSPTPDGDAVDLGTLLLTETFTTNVPDTNIPIGTVLTTGLTFTQYLKLRYKATFAPQIVAPSFALATNKTFVKVDEVVDVLLTFNFNRGAISLNGVFVTERAGAATGYTFKDAAGTNYPAMPQIGNTYTVAGFAVAYGANDFKALVAYAAGPQPVDSDGNNSGTPLAGATSAVQTASFEGVFAMYATVAGINNQDELPLFSASGNQDVFFTARTQLGTGFKQKFWVPNTESRTVTIIAKNGLTGLYTINETSSWATTAGIVIGGYNYVLYEYQGGDRGAIDLKIELR